MEEKMFESLEKYPELTSEQLEFVLSYDTRGAPLTRKQRAFVVLNLGSYLFATWATLGRALGFQVPDWAFSVGYWLTWYAVGVSLLLLFGVAAKIRELAVARFLCREEGLPLYEAVVRRRQYDAVLGEGVSRFLVSNRSLFFRWTMRFALAGTVLGLFKLGYVVFPGVVVLSWALSRAQAALNRWQIIQHLNLRFPGGYAGDSASSMEY